MKYTDNALNILTALSFNGITKAWVVKNLRGNESVDEIVSLLNKSTRFESINIVEFNILKRSFLNVLIEKFEECCDGVVALGDENFPKYRGNVKESERPVFLYYKGDIELLGSQSKNISVIGLLNPNGDIEERERKIVAQFVNMGAVIVSGLALGCDSIAHQQALDSNGKTVAILPSPLNKILPARNKGLAFQIVEDGGLLITEYGTDIKSYLDLSTRYKDRDRLQALFCDTIVLAASYAKDSAQRWKMEGQKLDSGARLAMGYAKDYGISRAVMYDEILDYGNPMFDLNRDLIKEQSNITIITEGNYIDTVDKIMNNIGFAPKVENTSVKPDLFNIN